MKPAEVNKVIAKASALMAILYGFKYLMWKGYALCDGAVVNEFNNGNLLSHERIHETIHARQALSLSFSKWMPYYKEYIKEWFQNLSLITINTYAPYKFTPMELEAYGKQYDENYIYTENKFPKPANLWKEIKNQINKDERKRLAKLWYSQKGVYNNNFSKFVQMEVFPLIK